MAEKDIIYTGKLKQKGIFNFKDFYEFSYDWLKEEGYDVFENKYSEKVAGDSKDLEIIWRAERKISDYFKYVITMDTYIWGLKKVKVKKEDKEISMDSGYLEIKFKAILEKDYENRWENHPFFKFLRGVYEKYIIRSRIEDYEDNLIEEIMEFISENKAFLAIEAKTPIV